MVNRIDPAASAAPATSAAPGTPAASAAPGPVKYAAFIPVRGGSKSIPLKNIRPICGQPLVYWTVEAALGCQAIDRVYVSTDSPDIRRVIDEFLRQHPEHSQRLACIGRSAETATDTASTESAMLEFAREHEFDNMILIQATSPMLKSADLDGAIAKYESGAFDSILSVVRQKRFVWAEDPETGAAPVNYDYMHRPRRQEFDGYLVENGAFYITPRASLLACENRLSGRIGTYEMAEETYFEIDEISDWIIISHLLEREQGDAPSPIGDLPDVITGAVGAADAASANAVGASGEAAPARPDIRLFITDCDGCLTDAGMYYSENGDELKKFCTLDGMGFGLLRQAGIRTGIITGENTQIVERRAAKLKLDHVCQGAKDKLAILRGLCEQEGITMAQVAYVGDDINDVACLKAAGIGFAVPNAMAAAKGAADVILTVPGGSGAVREAIEYILR